MKCDQNMKILQRKKLHIKTNVSLINISSGLEFMTVKRVFFE